MTAPFPSPTDIRITHLNRTKLTFRWNQASQNCPAIVYKIHAANCGICPSVTRSTSISCNITALVLPQTCILSVQTVVCNSLNARFSEPVLVSSYGIILTTDLGTINGYSVLYTLHCSSRSHNGKCPPRIFWRNFTVNYGVGEHQSHCEFISQLLLYSFLSYYQP